MIFPKGTPTKDVLEMIMGNSDPDRDAIIQKTSQTALKSIEVLANGNPIALEYLTDTWVKIFDLLKEGGINLGGKALADLLSIMATTLRERQILLNQLTESRKSKVVDINEH